MPRGGKKRQAPVPMVDAEPTAPAKPEFMLKRGALRKVNQQREERKESEEPFGGDQVRSRPGVEFQEQCDFYKVYLEDIEEKKPPKPDKPSALKSLRFFIMIVALISPFVTTYSRTIINFAIIDMIYVEPASNVDNSNAISSLTDNSTANMETFDLDRSCPVDPTVRARLIEESKEDTKRAQNQHGEKYNWDTDRQGLLIAAYSIGHAPFQIPGSRLAESYGARLVIGIGSLMIAICCISAPYLASISFYLIFVDLILLGVLGSFMTPALITLFSNWLTPSEKSLMMTFYLIASRLGYALSSFACGLLIAAQFSWRYVFFSAGWISLAYCCIFSLSVRSRPPEHPLIKQAELEYLASKNTLVRESLAKTDPYEQKHELKTVNGQSEDNQVGPVRKSRAPWLAILTNVPVWAFIITKFCVKLAGDTVQCELPTYLSKVMHFTASDNGYINFMNYLLFCFSCLGVGTLSKYVMKRKPFGLGKTAIRKCFQSIGSFGVSIALLGMAFSICDNASTQLYLILFFILTAFGIGGEAQIPLDITELYPGTIHAIGSSIAISGAIAPTLVGFLMRGHAADKDSWKTVWLGASAIAFLGGLVFLIFADASVQPFDVIDTTKGPEKDKDTSASKDNIAFEKDIGSDGKVLENELAKQEIVIVGYKESREI